MTVLGSPFYWNLWAICVAISGGNSLNLNAKTYVLIAGFSIFTFYLNSFQLRVKFFLLFEFVMNPNYLASGTLTRYVVCKEFSPLKVLLYGLN